MGNPNSKPKWSGEGTSSINNWSYTLNTRCVSNSEIDSGRNEPLAQETHSSSVRLIKWAYQNPH